MDGIVPSGAPHERYRETPEHEAQPVRPRSYAPASLTSDLAPPEFFDLTASTALQEVVDGLPEQIALLDESWNVLKVNRAWAEAAATAGLAGLGVGENYLQGCEQFARAGHPDSIILLEALRQIADGKRKYFHHVYRKSGLTHGDFKVNITRFESGGALFTTVTRYDVTKLMALTRQYRRLERSLVRVQEEERRRIGREIHDATAQQLVALHLSLIRLKALHADDATLAVVGELQETLDRINHEIRAISFLLHPPSLDDLGLVDAIDAMARGFSRRTDLRVGFWFDGHGERWEPMVEVTLYRLVQEALANVHRHAHATQVGIRLVARGGRFLHLIVEDDGIGIPFESASAAAPLGVGIAGMRSRIAELDGRFSIRRLPAGTCLVASIPLTPGPHGDY